MRKSPERVVLMDTELHMPGLMLLGRNHTTRAQKPLDFHVHEGCLEMVVMMKGRERYFTEDREYSLSGGEVFLSAPNQSHGNGQTEQGISEFIWFQICPCAQPGFLGLSQENGEVLGKRLQIVTSGKWSTNQVCTDLLERAFLAFSGGRPDERFLAQGLFLAALEGLLNQAEAQCRDSSCETGDQDPVGLETSADFHAFVTDYIQTHLSDSLEMHTLCGLCRLSESAFKRRFKEATGQTPREYINHRKIEKARRMLEAGTGITETAMSLGFSGSDYFSVVFKRHTATTPSEYRKAFARA